MIDYREKSLKDVITQLEPGLFEKVTGLEAKEFELLVSLGVPVKKLKEDKTKPIITEKRKDNKWKGNSKVNS